MELEPLRNYYLCFECLHGDCMLLLFPFSRTLDPLTVTDASTRRSDSFVLQPFFNLFYLHNASFSLLIFS
jgi:hypothetical protein